MGKFSTSLNGYSKPQVDKFVSDVRKNYEDVLNKLKESNLEIENLKHELKRYKNLEMTLNKAIVIANDTANQMRKMTQAESDSILKEARHHASRIVNEALMKAEKAENDANALKRRVEIYKRKITQVIDEEKEMIENINIDEY